MDTQEKSPRKTYTRHGDSGITSLASGRRVSKMSPQIAACGDLDELNSFIGLLACEAPPSVLPELRRIQHKLLDAGSLVSGSPKAAACFDGSETDALENQIDRLQAAVGKREGGFVLPGGCRTAALAHVCRRAERSICALETGNRHAALACFMNRLSDYFYTLALFFNHFHDQNEIKWEKGFCC